MHDLKKRLQNTIRVPALNYWIYQMNLQARRQVYILKSVCRSAMVLMKDVIKNISGDAQKATERINPESSAFNTNTTILEEMYKERVESALKEVLEKDEKYCRVNEETNQKIKDIDQIELTKEEWEIIDTALSAVNARSAEYGRVAYQQGFLDAVSLLRK